MKETEKRKKKQTRWNKQNLIIVNYIFHIGSLKIDFYLIKALSDAF